MFGVGGRGVMTRVHDTRAGHAVALSADARKITRASAETHLRYFERHHRYL